MRAAPCQRTTPDGISLPTATSTVAGCPASRRTSLTMSRRTARASFQSSRNATCSAQGTPAITRNPCSAAASMKFGRGTV